MEQGLNIFNQDHWRRNGRYLIMLLLWLLFSCTTPPDTQPQETAVPENTSTPEPQIDAEVEPTNESPESPPENNSAENSLPEEVTEQFSDVQSVTIQKIGFSQVGNQIGYGVIFFNPNQDYFVEEVLFNIKVFDADGNRLKMHVEKLDFITPEESAGVGGSFQLEDNQTAHRIEVNIDGQVKGSLVAPLILRFVSLPQNITFDKDTQVANADGLIINAIPDNSDENEIKGTGVFRVTAIAFDSAGNIIGGGQETIGQMVRNGSVSPASVTIPIVASRLPEKVELYANQGHGGGLCTVTIDRNSDSAHSECPLSTHTGG